MRESKGGFGLRSGRPQNHLLPRGSIYTTIMKVGPQNHNGDGRLGLNSIIVGYMDPLGWGQGDHHVTKAT